MCFENVKSPQSSPESLLNHIWILNGYLLGFNKAEGSWDCGLLSIMDDGEERKKKKKNIVHFTVAGYCDCNAA